MTAEPTRCCPACIVCWMTFGIFAPNFQLLVDGRFERALVELLLAVPAAWIAYRIGRYVWRPEVTT